MTGCDKVSDLGYNTMHAIDHVEGAKRSKDATWAGVEGFLSHVA
jgi:hypothetical protein